MSPGAVHKVTLSSSPPRASGDEPDTIFRLDGKVVSAPRERG